MVGSETFVEYRDHKIILKNHEIIQKDNKSYKSDHKIIQKDHKIIQKDPISYKGSHNTKGITKSYIMGKSQ